MLVHMLFIPASDTFLVCATAWSDLLPELIAQAAPEDTWFIEPSVTMNLACRLRAAGYQVKGLERHEDFGAWARLLLETVEKPYREKVFVSLLRILDVPEMRALAVAFEATR